MNSCTTVFPPDPCDSFDEWTAYIHAHVKQGCDYCGNYFPGDFMDHVDSPDGNTALMCGYCVDERNEVMPDEIDRACDKYHAENEEFYN